MHSSPSKCAADILSNLKNDDGMSSQSAAASILTTMCDDNTLSDTTTPQNLATYQSKLWTARRLSALLEVMDEIRQEVTYVRVCARVCAVCVLCVCAVCMCVRECVSAYVNLCS